MKSDRIDARYHILTDYQQDLSPRNATLDMRFVEATKHDEELRTKRRWFTSLCWNPAAKRLYCGQTHRAGNVLHAFDPTTGTFEDLGFQEVAEDNDMTFLFRCDRESKHLEVLGRVMAEDGTACYRPHDMVLVGDTAYVAETDSPGRSGYLWECKGIVGRSNG